MPCLDPWLPPILVILRRSRKNCFFRCPCSCLFRAVILNEVKDPDEPSLTRSARPFQPTNLVYEVAQIPRCRVPHPWRAFGHGWYVNRIPAIPPTTPAPCVPFPMD